LPDAPKSLAAADVKMVEMQLDSEAIDPSKVVQACEARRLGR